jgi:hypothetical protein
LEFVEFKPDVRLPSFNASATWKLPCTSYNPKPPHLTIPSSTKSTSTIRNQVKLANVASPQGEWKATGIESSSKFTAIDLTEGDWYDYDEKTSEEVSIKDVKFEIRRA